MSALISRRQALGVLATTIATAAASPARALGSWRTGGETAELDAWIAERLGEADVKSIGDAWVAAHPAESSVETLTRAIMGGRRAGEALGTFLSRKTMDEHRAGRAEVLDGWFLAPTEARIAALARVS